MEHLIDEEAFASDEDREAQKRALIEEAKDREAFQTLMSTPAGRRVARQVMAVSGLLDTGFSGDVFAAGYREGQRSVGAWLTRSVKQHAPEQFTTLFEDEA